MERTIRKAILIVRVIVGAFEGLLVSTWERPLLLNAHVVLFEYGKVLYYEWKIQYCVLIMFDVDRWIHMFSQTSFFISALFEC